MNYNPRDYIIHTRDVSIKRDDTAYADHLLGGVSSPTPSEDVMDQPDNVPLSDLGKCPKQKQARIMRQYD